MIANKIRNARKALSALGGSVTEDVWAVIKCIQSELDDAATQAQQIEELLPVPPAADNTGTAAAIAPA